MESPPHCTYYAWFARLTMETLVTVLENLYDLNKIACPDSGKVIVTFDIDLYKRALKLEYIDP